MSGLLLLVLAAAMLAAYHAGRHHPVGLDVADLNRRVARLERDAGRRPEPVARMGSGVKTDAVAHYEALADQVARERQVAELAARAADRAAERDRLASTAPTARVMRFPSRPIGRPRDRQNG
jgi:hypothetical protein